MSKTIQKNLKRFLCVTLGAVMIFSFTSCSKLGGSTGNVSGIVVDAADAEGSKDAVFRRTTPVELPFNADKILTRNGKIVFFSDSYGSPEYGMDDWYWDDMGFSETEEIIEEDESSEEFTEEAGEGEGETPEVIIEEEVPEDTADETAQGDLEESEFTEGEIAEGDFSEEDFFEDEPFEEPDSLLSFGWITADSDGTLGKDVIYQENYPATKSRMIECENINANGNLIVGITEFDYEKEKYTRTLLEISLDGEKISETPIAFPATVNEIYRMFITDSGVIAATTDDGLYLFDEDANQTGRVDIKKNWEVLNILSNAKNEIYLVYYNENYTMNLCKILPESQSVGESIDANGSFGIGYKYISSTQHDFYCQDSAGIYTADIDDDEIEYNIIFNFLDSDVMDYDLQSFACLDDETVILADRGEGELNGIYKKVPPAEIKDKKIITLGSVYSVGYDIRQRILEYNKTSEDYRIRMVDYEKFYSEDDPLAPERQFQNDILSSAGPDIIVTSYMVNPGIYISKGVFADIYPLMEKSGINKEDYLSNILEAGSRDGHLYVLMPGFSVEYVALKKSILGDRPGISMKEMIELEKQYDCVGGGFSQTTRQMALEKMLYYTADSFYDVGAGECNFDSEEFIEALEWAKNYPEELESDDDYLSSVRAEEAAFHKNECLMSEGMLYDFRRVNELQDITFGEDVAFIGFPGSTNPSSGAIVADLGFAISALGDNQEAAFDFIKYYLSEDYQMPDDKMSSTYQIPILKKALEEKFRIESEDPFYYNERTGKKEYHKETGYSYARGKEIEVETLSDKDIEMIRNFIESTTNFTNYDRQIFDIVKEEAAPFFAGQKTAEDAARIIQSRARIYVLESL